MSARRPGRRAGCWLLAAAVTSACARTAGAPRVLPERDAAAAAATLAAGPRAVGTIVLLGVELPQPGQRIGGHFEGALFDAEVSSLRMGDAPRRRWADAARDAGDSVLRAAGYTVRRAPTRTSDPAPLAGVRFGLAGTVELVVRSVGRVEPRRVFARVETTWELLDLAGGAAVFATRTRGAAQRDDSIGGAVVAAVAQSLGALLGDSAFRVALATPRLRTLDDLVFDALWEQPLPGMTDTVWIAPDDANPSAAADPVQRVASGVFTVHGRGPQTVSAMAVTRGGLAVAAGLPLREQRLWGRFHDGVDRPLRILRSRGGLSLLQLQCDDPCTTVPWTDSSAVTHATPVFIVAGPVRRGDAFYVANGRFFLRQRRSDDVASYDLSVADAAGGEPVARRQDGAVFAVATARGAVLLAEAFRILGVARRP